MTDKPSPEPPQLLEQLRSRWGELSLDERWMVATISDRREQGPPLAPHQREWLTSQAADRDEGAAPP
jgi:hypothetical protein